MKYRALPLKLVTAFLASPLTSTFSRSQQQFNNNFRLMSASGESSEVLKADIAASTDPAVNPFAPTFFDKLVKKEIPSTVIYEDELW